MPLLPKSVIEWLPVIVVKTVPRSMNAEDQLTINLENKNIGVSVLLATRITQLPLFAIVILRTISIGGYDDRFEQAFD